jgi:hypothetical protein
LRQRTSRSIFKDLWRQSIWRWSSFWECLTIIYINKVNWFLILCLADYLN